MSLYQFNCVCGTDLVLPSKVRPVCRRCGKQMKLAGKVKTTGPVRKADIKYHNARYGR